MSNSKFSLIVQQAGLAIYEADPTLKHFDDLPEDEKVGYYLQAQAALKSFLESMGKIAVLQNSQPPDTDAGNLPCP